MNLLVELGSAGGIVAVIGGVVVVARGIFRQVSSTDANTEAIRELSGKIDKLTAQQNGLITRVTVLEERTRR